MIRFSSSMFMVAACLVAGDRLRHRGFRLRQQLFAQLSLVIRQLLLYVLGYLRLLDQILAIAPQEIVNGFDADSDGARRLVLIQVLECKIGSPGTLDDVFDNGIDRGIWTTLAISDLRRSQVG